MSLGFNRFIGITSSEDGQPIAQQQGLGAASDESGVLQTVSREEAEGGVASVRRIWTAERVRQAIQALGAGGGGADWNHIANMPAYVAAGDTASAARAAIGLGSASTAQIGDFATAIQGAKADTAIQPNAGLGTLDAAADTKLNGIQAGATANQADAYLLDRANHTGTQPMASIGDKQGKVLDDLTPILVADLDSAVEPKGYLVSYPGEYLDGTQLFVQQTQEGLVTQTMHIPLVGKSAFRTKPVGGAWSDFSFTIAPFDIIGWHSDTTTDAPNAVINSNGTFSRSIATYNPNPLLVVSGASHAFVKADVNKYARYTDTGAKTATFDSSEGFDAGDAFHIANRAASGNITISGTGVTFNAPKGGTLVLEPKDTVTVKFVSPTEADVMGSVVAA